MKTITMTGWSAKLSAVVERVTFWPDEMGVYVAVAKAAQVTDLMTIEDVLVEEDEKHTVKIPVAEVLDLQEKEREEKEIPTPTPTQLKIDWDKATE